MRLKAFSLVAAILVVTVCCVHSQFIVSRQDLAENGVIDRSFNAADFQNEIETVAAFLHVPVAQSGASCVSVGTSEELYANFSGSSIDSYDIVVRNGFYYHYLIDVAKHSFNDELYSRDTYAGNHYKVVGMRMDYILFYPYDFFTMNHKLRRTWQALDTVLVAVIKTATDLKRLSIELKALNYSPKIAILSRNSFQQVQRWSGGSDPSFNALGAQLCKMLTQKRPITVYGVFQPYDWIEDTLPSGSNNCEPSSMSVNTEDSEWQHFVSDRAISVEGLSFHNDLYERIKADRVPEWKPPVGYSCPMQAMSAEGRKKHGSCAVVGAAPYLGCMNLGSEIDSHDAVYRTNIHLPQPGRGALLGTFTTHLLSQTTTFIQLLQDVGCVIKFPIHGRSMTICETAAGSAALLNYGYIAEQDTELRLLDIDEALDAARTALGITASTLYDYLYAVSRRGSGYKLTTGMYSVLAALQECESVDVYGMSVGPLHMHVHSYLMEIMTLRALQAECGSKKFRLVLPNRKYESYVDAWLYSETMFFKSKQSHPLFVTSLPELMEVAARRSDMKSVAKNIKSLQFLMSSLKQPTPISKQLPNTKKSKSKAVAVVGTSAELYSSYGGSDIDTHSVVLRSGSEVTYAVGVDGKQHGLTYHDTTSGRHYRCVGTKTDYVVIDADDISITYKNMRSTLEVYDGEVAAIVRSVSDINSLVAFINSSFPSAVLENSEVNIVIPKAYVFTSLFYTSKRVSELSIAVQIAKRMLDSQPVTIGSVVDVYGSFMPYPPELDDITISCTKDVEEMPLTYLEWEQLRDDARVNIMERSFHEQFFTMDYTVSRKLEALLSGNSCPMNTASITPLRSCAVVGAAPSVYCGRHGRDIDAHDAVFRTNFHLPTQDLKAFVGSKTTHVVVQVDHMAQPYIDAGCIPENTELKMNSMHFLTVDSPYCKRSLQNKGLEIPERGAVLLVIDPYKYVNDLTVFPSKQLSKSSLSYFLKHITESGHASRLSSGMISFLYAITHCQSVDVYGFSVGQLQLYIHSFLWELLAIRAVEIECDSRITLHLPSDQYKRYTDTWLTSKTTLFPL